MDKLTSFDLRVSYLPKRYYPLLALFSGHYVTVFRQPKSFRALFFQPNYWVVLSFSFAVALCVLFYVTYITSQFDGRYPWYNDQQKRFFMQALFGFGLPSLFVLLAVRAFFAFFHANFAKSGYLNYEYPVVCFFILCFNAILVSHYFIAHGLHHRLMSKWLLIKMQEQEVLHKRELDEANQKIEALEMAGEQMRKNLLESELKWKSLAPAHVTLTRRSIRETVPVDQLLCVVRRGETTTVYYETGSQEVFDDDLDSLIEAFKDTKVCRVSRWAFVNLDFLDGYRKPAKKGRRSFIFASTAAVTVQLFDRVDKLMDDLKLSYTYYEEFLNAWHKYKT